MNKLKEIELFAGIGAQRQALKEAGMLSIAFRGLDYLR